MLTRNIKSSHKPAAKCLAKSRKGKKRRTDKRPEEVEVVKHDPMESLRVYVADTLSGFKGLTINRYEAGFRASFEEFANMLHPAGYKRDRSNSELITGLRKSSTKCTMAHLQNIKAVRNMLDEILKGIVDDPFYPFSNRFLCGFEDANWLLLGSADPWARAAALRFLYQ
jgi:hypothetical protein